MTQGASTGIDTSTDETTAVRLVGTMLRIREFEVLAERLFLDGKLPGFVHVSIGQEAVAAGTCDALLPGDYITSTHRGHGHAIAKGASPKLMMAELFGKVTGLCRGRGGSMHIADFAVGMLGANGVVAGGLGIACGSALTAKLTNSGAVTVAFFGDGAVARGPFHEALNLASVWKLPVVFLCESNGWASTMRTAEVIAGPGIAAKADSYGMPGVLTDGDDVFAVRASMIEAVARAREGGGPTLVEARTQRWRGHFVGDPMQYRTAEERASIGSTDPVARAAESAISSGMLTSERYEALGAAARLEMAEAVEFAKTQPDPDPSRVMDDVYAEAPA